MMGSGMDAIRALEAARAQFWIDHPELKPFRRKVKVLIQRTAPGSYVTVWRWKTDADRRLDRRLWLEYKLFDCYCPSCPERVWWQKLIMWMAEKLDLV